MKPLITFALFAYNQESFIREAVEGALSQTYSPLEIILSDDSSMDATFQVMQDMVNKYRGCHQVILNRNMTNLGIAGHVNRIFKLAHGRLVIFAAGDDISLPERTQANYEAWETTQRKSLCIFSGISAINKEGQVLKYNRYNHSCRNARAFAEERYSVSEFLSGKKPLIVGGAAAWSPHLMEVFGPLPEIVVHEDEALALRTTCLGSFTYIASNLVKYRLHDNNVHGRIPRVATSFYEINQEDVRKQLQIDIWLKRYEGYLIDLKTARKKSLIDQYTLEHASGECCKQLKMLRLKVEFNRSSFLKKVSLFFQLRKMGMPFIELRSFVYKLLPAPIYRSLRLLRNRLHHPSINQ